jgi:signal transduction histidine kinase
MPSLIQSLQLRDVVSGQVLKPENTGWARAARGEHSVREVLVRQRNTGQDLVVRMATAPIFRGGDIVGIVAVAADITEQKRHENALRDEAIERERFISVLTHDLRNPLNTILLGTSTLLRMGPPDENRTRVVERIQRGAQRISGMVGDLLDLTRLRAGHGLPIQPQPMDAETVTRQIIEEFEGAHGERSILLDCKGPTRGTWDPARIAQLLSNLLKNALDYGDRTAPVTVRVAGTRKSLALEVGNRGPVIPSDVQASIFNPYQRGEAGQRSTSGLGLGLYIVRQIAEAHGGAVSVRSSEEGTTFCVELPHREQQPQRKRERDSGATSAPAR